MLGGDEDGVIPLLAKQEFTRARESRPRSWRRCGRARERPYDTMEIVVTHWTVLRKRSSTRRGNDHGKKARETNAWLHGFRQGISHPSNANVKLQGGPLFLEP